MKIVKFGGKSLANGKGIQNTIEIIKSKLAADESFIVVLSARGNTTGQLETILEKAKKGESYTDDWNKLKSYQSEPVNGVDFIKEYKLLSDTFEGVALIKDYSLKIKDLVLAHGELFSIKTVAHILNTQGIESIEADSRLFLKTDSQFGNAQIDYELTEKDTLKYFKGLNKTSLAIVSGFIASDAAGETTTLGRNGSNYSASLLAAVLKAEEFQNYTHINGIYTANPEIVKDAKIIKQISYKEANELASFGASILHAKTIFPLSENNIPLRILNTFNLENEGTLIAEKSLESGIKSITQHEDIGLILLEGKSLLGKIGIDGRIFSVLSTLDIGVSFISQGTSERSIGFVVEKEKVNHAISALNKEFQNELHRKNITSVKSVENLSTISVVGQDINQFTNALTLLNKNSIPIFLINNTINGKNIGLVINKKDVKKAVNIIHSQIFGAAKNIHITIFGKGTVGTSLINQILKSKEKIQTKKDTNLIIFAISGTQKVLFKKSGVCSNWKANYEAGENNTNAIEQVIRYADENHLENLIAIDNTASEEFIKGYSKLVSNGFDLISSNKIANTQCYESYTNLRSTIKENNKQYLYETNVGAGLPIIDTIKLLHESGENITRIRGVFSGSLSYIFNQFSVLDKPFSTILQESVDKGFTEPDPREDLNGNDVARKLLILARELDLENEFSEIKIKNLVPKSLQNIDKEVFLQKLNKFDNIYAERKAKCKVGNVLRYVGDLYGDLQQTKANLEVDLIEVEKNSALGNLKGSDSIFEIYTESYGEKPITIIGAGAGAEVTARGVFGDVLRIAEKK